MYARRSNGVKVYQGIDLIQVVKEQKGSAKQ